MNLGRFWNFLDKFSAKKSYFLHGKKEKMIKKSIDFSETFYSFLFNQVIYYKIFKKSKFFIFSSK